jgi:hypothetical protein
MIKFTLGISILWYALFFGNVSAQKSDSGAIMTPIYDFFSGMRKQDTSLIRLQMHEKANHLLTFRLNKEGKTKIDSISVSDFLKAVVKDKNAVLDEKILNPQIHNDSPLATVWVDYEFWYNGKLSHGGVDAFTLIKVNDLWKIIQVVDTHKKTK